MAVVKGPKRGLEKVIVPASTGMCKGVGPVFQHSPHRIQNVEWYSLMIPSVLNMWTFWFVRCQRITDRRPVVVYFCFLDADSECNCCFAEVSVYSKFCLSKSKPCSCIAVRSLASWVYTPDRNFTGGHNDLFWKIPKRVIRGLCCAVCCKTGLQIFRVIKADLIMFKALVLAVTPLAFHSWHYLFGTNEQHSPSIMACHERPTTLGGWTWQMQDGL